ncbi:hypothetical protein L226DRAFT_610917 [Lentinus tigrinus ALCF2SS1-7]|uniref:F-box domain-containing protein n=1 Tax=Lentinus tigrinus ALCF2SS1-6 TaxID=1328759 RepID=A0A5C2SH12_9APHY|nr:hypothetical protein L227DRAFT_651517 [Lentinus tigrinus ALCF2SS1-6]RPD77673.1 hypothetical protein L226DRAFT_610917 [Lentinus tigrinus ALCF2SS1-7]
MSSTIQHRTLHIAEIFRHICDVADNMTLAILARTCKAFQEPSLQALWRILPDFVPLVKCFPHDCWIIQNDELRFARLPLPNEWIVFLKYAKLVKSLGCRYHTSPLKLHAGVIDALCALRPTLVLFPNIRSLDWPIMDLRGSSLPPTLSLLGDGITALWIESYSRAVSLSEQMLQTAIAIIASRFRYLKSLHISLEDTDPGIGIDSEVSTALSSLLVGLHALTEFKCLDISLSSPTIMHLAQLITLQDLEVRLPDSWTCPEPTVNPFASLTTITLATTIYGYIQFSKAVPLPHIQKFCLYVEDDPPAQLIPDFFSAIRRQFSPISLQNLSINPAGVPNETRARQSGTVIHPADLWPLLEFSLMKNFDFAMECHYALHDAFILHVAKAWPHLETFYLCNENYCVHDTLPSLTALAHLAVHAHNLAEVGLQFDAAGWTRHPDFDHDGGPPEQLYGELQGRASTSDVYSLHVGISPIALPEKVALFLARVFPALESLVTSAFANAEDRALKRWREVERYLPMFVRIRADERLRLQQEPTDACDDEYVMTVDPDVP